VLLAVPFAVAVTEQVPTGDVVDVVQVEEDNEALAPLVGTVNVTTLPLTGLLYASSTCTIRGLVNAAPIAALWPVPDATFTTDAVAAATVMFVLVVLGEPLLSATVKVCVPEVFSVTETVPVPEVSVVLPGRIAAVSLDVNFTGPV